MVNNLYTLNCPDGNVISDLYSPVIKEFSDKRLQLTIARAQQHLDNKEPDAAQTLLDRANTMVASMKNVKKEITDQLNAMAEKVDELLEERFGHSYK